MEADKVVVELVARVESFDRKIKQSASSFDSSMNRMERSGRKAEVATVAMDRKVSGLGRSVGKLGRILPGVAAGFGLAFGAGAINFLKQGIEGAQAQAAALAQVKAALASMGPVSGKVADELNRTANALEAHSLFEAEDILAKVTANLLTFGNVSGQVFDRAQQAALDMSTRLGVDLKGSAILVGKALNDPIRGLSAMTRVGIQFTEQQRNQIKAMVEAGDTAGAQGIILKELERQFRGAAQAAADTDPWRQAEVAWGQAADKIGEALLPAIKAVSTEIAEGIPKIAEWAEGFSQRLRQAGTDIDDFLRKAAEFAGNEPVPADQSQFLANWNQQIDALEGKLAEGQSALDAFEAHVKDTTAKQSEYWSGLWTDFETGWNDLVASFGPIRAAISDDANSVGRAFEEGFGQAKAAVESLASKIRERLSNGLEDVWGRIKQRAKEAGDAFKTLWDRVVGHSYVPDMVEGIRAEMAKLDAVMVGPARRASKATGDSFEALQGRVRSILDRLFPEQAKTNQLNLDLADLTEWAKRAKIPVEQLAEAIQRLNDEYYGSALTDVPILGGKSSEDLGAEVTTGAEAAGGTTDQPWNEQKSPLQEWADTIPQTAEEINAALQSIEARGLNSLADALTGVIMGTQSLGDAFKQIASQIIADILRMTIKMLIFKAIQSAIGMPGGFAGGGEVGAGGGLGSFGGGGNAFPTLFPGGATGGRVVGPGTGTSDSIPIRVSDGEFIIRKKSVDRIGAAQLQYMNRTGRVPGFSEGGQVRRISPANVPAAAPGSGNTIVQQTFMLDARYGITTPELLNHVNSVARREAVQAGRSSFEASQRAFPNRLKRFQRLEE